MRHRATSDGCGEIVEVEGGHIVRSTGRKDRHSRVCTAKGPRDRRVRLSAHTAIQFYDVQDRLGFDRPSKAVDWLIKNAQTSIDELAQLPPWNPADAIRNADKNAKPRRTAAKTKISPSPPPPPPQQQQLQFGNVSSYLPPSMDSDLSLSLHSFPDVPPSLLNHHHHSASEPVMFYGQSNPLGYDTSTSGWNNSGGNGGGGFLFAPTSFQSLLGQSQLYSQRGPLQSNYTPMLRAWFDPHLHHSISTDDLNHHQCEFSSGFHVPALFQGQEEEQHHGLTNKPSSASSVSRHS